MSPEFWMAVAGAFLSGGVIGAAGTLLSQWVYRRIAPPAPAHPRPALPEREVEMLRADLADLDRKVANLDARLDFQEQLVGGGTPSTPPPPRLAAEPRAAESERDGGDDAGHRPRPSR